MVFKKILLLLIIQSFTYQLKAQKDTISLMISVIEHASPIFISDSGITLSNDSNIHISALKFYISKIQLLKEGKVVFDDKQPAHLIDAAQQSTYQIYLTAKKNIAFDQVVFNLGIDSAINVAGVYGGALDPTKGMYWTWQSGFINFKIEGNYQYQKKNTAFAFHLGGYRYPDNALQKISMQTDDKLIKIYLDISKVFEQIDIMKVNHIMSPCQEAVQLSKIIADSFKIIGK